MNLHDILTALEGHYADYTRENRIKEATGVFKLILSVRARIILDEHCGMSSREINVYACTFTSLHILFDHTKNKYEVSYTAEGKKQSMIFESISILNILIGIPKSELH